MAAMKQASVSRKLQTVTFISNFLAVVTGERNFIHGLMWSNSRSSSIHDSRQCFMVIALVEIYVTPIAHSDVEPLAKKPDHKRNKSLFASFSSEKEDSSFRHREANIRAARLRTST
jgi:hypothetical protein